MVPLKESGVFIENLICPVLLKSPREELPSALLNLVEEALGPSVNGWKVCLKITGCQKLYAKHL